MELLKSASCNCQTCVHFKIFNAVKQEESKWADEVEKGREGITGSRGRVDPSWNIDHLNDESMHYTSVWPMSVVLFCDRLTDHRPMNNNYFFTRSVYVSVSSMTDTNRIIYESQHAYCWLFCCKMCVYTQTSVFNQIRKITTGNFLTTKNWLSKVRTTIWQGERNRLTVAILITIKGFILSSVS